MVISAIYKPHWLSFSPGLFARSNFPVKSPGQISRSNFPVTVRHPCHLSLSPSLTHTHSLTLSLSLSLSFSPAPAEERGNNPDRNNKVRGNITERDKLPHVSGPGPAPGLIPARAAYISSPAALKNAWG